MNSSKRAVAVVYLLVASLLSFGAEALDAREADLASRTFAAVQTAKQKCVNTCRARYRECLALKQMPSSRCRDVSQDCTRLTCNGLVD